MKQVGVGVGLIIRRDERFLLYRRLKAPEANHWGIVGGKLDFMENTLDAARREAEEETGLTFGTLKLLGAWEQTFPADNQHWVSFLYETSDAFGEAQVTEPDKMPEFGWFLPSELPQPLTVWTKIAIQALLKKE